MSIHRYTDETKRRHWQNPEEVLDDIGLKPGHTFVDVGCGNGFFALPAARLVGLGGKVYGVDIGSEAIDELRWKAAGEGLTNLQLTVGRAEEIILCHDCADIVFFGNALHHFQHPVEVIKNARTMLKPGGKLANLDWKKVATPFGPPLSIRFDEATATSLIELAGFDIETAKESGRYHYLIITDGV
jgi:ubiquinone/menaquinone biosynthesis C-methylase UbiE